MLFQKNTVKACRYYFIDFLPALKDGDSSGETLKPERENVPGGVRITVVMRAALRASPFSYS